MPELIGETVWLNGSVSKDELIGEKPCIVHFWSVSCQLCTDVMPEFNRLRNKYRNALNVVAVHMPRIKEDLDLNEIKLSVNKYGMIQPVFVDNSLRLTNQFGNQFVPAYYLFDRDGKLRHVQAGGGGMNLLEVRVKRLLEEAKRR